MTATAVAVPTTERELSKAEWLSVQPPDIVEEFFSSLTEEEVKNLPYTWEFWGRPKQLPPPGNAWAYWLLLAGRGFGKSRSINEWAIDRAIRLPGSRGAIVARTAGDVRDVVVEGESGILNISPPNFMPNYEPSKRRLTWPNGSVATTFSADEPKSLRGPQFHWAIADELATWRFTKSHDQDGAWDMLQMGLRLDAKPAWNIPNFQPQCAIATTPRPRPIIKDLLDDPYCVVVRGTTYENRANVAESWYRTILRKYEGTRLGRQELMAQILDDVPGALWSVSLLESTRVTNVKIGTLYKIVVAVDPAASTGQTGIIVVGVRKESDGRGGFIDHGYVLDDVTPEAGVSPGKWASAAIAAYNKYEADAIVAEVNHGGDMVETVIRSVEGGNKVNYRTVRASRGKHTRAEPVSTLYEAGRGHMVGFFDELEEELREWVPGESESPNRLDAMVWGYTDLMIEEEEDKSVNWSVR